MDEGAGTVVFSSDAKEKRVYGYAEYPWNGTQETGDSNPSREKLGGGGGKIFTIYHFVSNFLFLIV